jgi:hypothetical protein
LILVSSDFLLAKDLSIFSASLKHKLWVSLIFLYCFSILFFIDLWGYLLLIWDFLYYLFICSTGG